MENLRLSDEFLNIEEEEREDWKIKDDLSADWAIDKIRETNAEYNRFEMVAKAKIQQIQEALQKEQEKRDREVSFFESKLREYFESIQVKETKTQKTYKLPSGTLKMKKSSMTFKYDKKKLIEVAEKYDNMTDYIKIKKDFNWAEFKKNLEIKGNSIINKNTGEILEMEGLEIVEKPEEFKVEA